MTIFSDNARLFGEPSNFFRLIRTFGVEYRMATFANLLSKPDVSMKRFATLYFATSIRAGVLPFGLILLEGICDLSEGLFLNRR
jgi:hypothetical protein